MSDTDILYEVKQLHQWKSDREPVVRIENKFIYDTLFDCNSLFESFSEFG